jgi:predicted RNA-binding Zn-ribbon protein involved in translation (DUF1610 family)
MRSVKLICETVNCENKNISIVLETDATQYMCGGCGQFITNAEEVTDGNTEETE